MSKNRKEAWRVLKFVLFSASAGLIHFIVCLAQRVGRLEILALLLDIVATEHIVEFYLQSSLYLQIGC